MAVSKEAKIWIGIIVLVIVVMGGIFALGNRSSKQPATNSQNVVRSDSHKLGSGKVTVVEFGDYQCPACGAAYPITKQMLSNYGDKITFVFRNYPLPQHANAPEAAQAAEAAASQGKFWEMHDILYATQNDWANLSDPTSNFVGYAQQLGLNIDTFKQAVQAKQYASVISTDKSDGDTLGISGTPTFYVNGVAQPDFSYNTLKGAIEAALK